MPSDKQLLERLEELERLQLIRRKAGGFIWIHSPSRDRIRQILGDPIELAKLTGCSDWDPTREAADIHRALADWYTKVLDSSSSSSAIFEIAYHLCKSAEAELRYSRESEKIQRARTMIEASAALLGTHRLLIQMRGYSRESCRRLDYTRGALAEDVRRATPASHQDAHLITEALRNLDIVCTEIMRAIAREVGEDRKAYLRHRQLAMRYLNDQTEGEDDLSHRLYSTVSSSSDLKASAWLRWLRWWRWCGMLGIASRSFLPAERSLSRALKQALNRTPHDPKSQYDITLTDEDWKGLAYCDFPSHVSSGADIQDLRVEVLRSAEQLILLRSLTNSVERRLARLSRAARNAVPDRHNPPHNMEHAIQGALELARTIRENDRSASAHHTVEAAWCQSRLLLHLSGCKLEQSQIELMPRTIPQTAMALLGDAEACLRVADPQRHRAEMALIDLHRAEVRLRLADLVPLEWPDNAPETAPATVSGFHRDLESWRPIGNPPRVREEFHKRFPWLCAKPGNLTRIKSFVGDALRFLARAEPILLERRRNVWWTTWFFERQLRAVAITVWLSIFDRTQPIPYLGFEAAAWNVDTLADTALDSAYHMIRVDSYRFATIVDAYTSCAKALQVRLYLGELGELDLYNRRQAAMRQRLKDALDQLEHVNKRRTRDPEDPIPRDSKADISASVRDYITEVLMRGREICAGHWPPL
jgi:hypothetical protein